MPFITQRRKGPGVVTQLRILNFQILLVAIKNKEGHFLEKLLHTPGRRSRSDGDEEENISN